MTTTQEKYHIKKGDILPCNFCQNGYIVRKPGGVRVLGNTPQADVCSVCKGTQYLKVRDVTFNGWLFFADDKVYARSDSR